MENIYIIHNGELYHHGVKGQKWGVRRYQNKDGTLTSLGKRRDAKKEKPYKQDLGDGTYAVWPSKKAFEKAEAKRLSKLSKEQYDAEKQSVIRSGNKSTVHQWKSRLSTQELREAVDRIDLERRLSSVDKKTVDSGQQRVTSAIKTIGSVAGLLGLAVGTYGTVAKINNTFNPNIRLPEINGTYYKKQNS